MAVWRCFIKKYLIVDVNKEIISLRSTRYFNIAKVLYDNRAYYHAESNKNRETHFGFETVTEEEKEEKVRKVFSSVASKYDIMNDVMSGGIHRFWKDYFIQKLGPVPGTKLLDVAGGTGDIAFRFLQAVKSLEQQHASWTGDNSNQNMQRNLDLTSHSQEADKHSIKDSESDSSSDESEISGTHVTVLDINNEMLQVGKQRAADQGFKTGITWIQANAEELPFPDNSFDVYTVAFGIRNVVRIEKALSEAQRVLKPYGRFMCLEFSKVNNPLVERFYDWYSFQIIPVMGQIIARDWRSYQYLVESIRKFPDQEEYKEMLENVGFRMVTYENLFCGVAAIHSGFKTKE